MQSSDREEIDRHVEAVQRGDGDAYRLVVERLIGRVRAFVAGRSIPGVDVDDIVQQSFFEAYKSIREYEIGSDFAAWVVTIARYQLFAETSRLRRLADYHRKYVPVALARECEQRLGRSDELEAERLLFLKECLEAVPPIGRSVIERRYADASSIDEIAKVMNRSAGAIRKQLCLLRKQLHDCVTRRVAQEGRS